MRPRYERPVIVKHALGGHDKFGARAALRIVDRFEGVPIADLVAAYGSPLFVFSERILRQRHRDLSEEMSRRFADFAIAWSYKTN
ncbi:MAG: hypothetical protein KC731_43390, partial [Myxococcales bacterium]|nr:hypothetical protein [Myxococcales bacterium]